MQRRSRELWPFDPLAAVLAVPLLLFGLVIAAALVRQLTRWPPAELDQVVFLAILGLSVLPVILMTVDMLADRGARIGFRGLTVDFSASAVVPATYTVPQNIGLPGHAISDSASNQIIDALRGATTNEVVVVDLEDGTAWWETRLLVLLAGAARLGRPSAVVFTATEAGISNRFQGWGPPTALFPLLLRADDQYAQTYFRVKAWARQWETVPPQLIGQPAPHPWMKATGPPHAAFLFEQGSGLPSDLGFEQLLQSELGKGIEGADDGPRRLSVGRVQDVFRPVLRTDSVDEAWSPDRQIDELLKSDDDYIAITASKRYQRLLTRTSALAGLIRSVVLPGAM